MYQFLSMIRQAGWHSPHGQGRAGHVSSLWVVLQERGAPRIRHSSRLRLRRKAPELKRKTIEARKAAKQEAEEEWKLALKEGDLKRALSKATRTAKLDSDMIGEALSLLDAMGIPWIKAPSEGEAQMGHMARKGDVWAGASQDFDAILFGTPNLVRNLTLAGKRRLPSGKTVDVVPQVVSLGDVLGTLQVTRGQLVDMSILIGTDFNDGVRGIGPKKALALIKKHGRLEDIPKDGKVMVPDEYLDIRRIFLEPDVTDDYKLAWGSVRPEDVRRIMCDRHSFSVDRIDAVLSKVVLGGSTRAQSNLESWS